LGQVAAPTGTVQFFQGDRLIGQSPVGSDGVALVVTSGPVDLSNPAVDAVYLGDSNYLGARSAAANLPALLDPEATSTSLTIAVSRSRFHTPYQVVLQATVHGSAGELITTGAVTFSATGSRKIVVPIQDGVATLTLKVGCYKGHSALAEYEGSPGLLPSVTRRFRFPAPSVSKSKLGAPSGRPIRSLPARLPRRKPVAKSSK
jgi:hypothetical protein